MTTKQVTLEGGAPWGFRIRGGADTNQPIRVARVNPGSKASHAGIREGDLITSIGGRSTKGISNAEAHGLLRAAEEGKLVLGLNEESGGSPKRRQYKTIHQETLQETVKRSNVTTYSLKETIESSQTNRNNEHSSVSNEKTINGTSKNIPIANTLVLQRSTLCSSPSTSSSSSTLKEDFKNTSTDNAEASRRSSYTNCTLSPSTGSLFSEDGYFSCCEQSMNESQPNSSRSKKRRNRRRNRKTSESSAQNVTKVSDNSIQSSTSNKLEETDKKHTLKIVVEDYIVDSPKELNKDSKLAIKPVKSRSLDDDEMVKIQELSDISGAEDKDKENQAIISEASESEAEHDKVPQPSVISEEDSSLRNYLQGLNLSANLEETPQETYERITATPLLSIEEEKSLRSFLQGLNLVTGPEEAAQHVYDNANNESIKQRKARRKAELEQYFLPISQNPRFLEAISEEASDRDSDREQIDLKKHLKQGTPELDLPPKVPPRPNRDKRRARLNPTEELAVLVDARIVDTGNISHAICTTMKTEEAASGVEVVFLSSGTSTPEEDHSTSSNSYVLEEENGSSIEDVSTSTLEIENNENENNENESKEANNRIEDIYNNSSKTEKNMLNSIETENDDSSKTIKSSPETRTISESDKLVTADKNTTADLLTQLTPPPTPEDVSPKSEKTVATSNAKATLQDHFIHVYNNASKEDMYKRFIDKHQIKKTEECCPSSYMKSTESLVNDCRGTEQSKLTCEKKDTVKKEFRDELGQKSEIKETTSKENKIVHNSSSIQKEIFTHDIRERNKITKEVSSIGTVKSSCVNGKMSSIDELKRDDATTVHNKPNVINKNLTSTVNIDRNVCMQQKLDQIKIEKSTSPTQQGSLTETKNVAYISDEGIGKKNDYSSIKQNIELCGTVQEFSLENNKNHTAEQNVKTESHAVSIKEPTVGSANVDEGKVLENETNEKLDTLISCSTPNKTIINGNQTSSTINESVLKNIRTDVRSPPPRPPMCKDTVLSDTYNTINDETSTAKAEFIRKNVMSPPPRPPMYKCTPINEANNDVIKQDATSSLRYKMASPIPGPPLEIPVNETKNVTTGNKYQTSEIGVSRRDLISPPPRPPMYQETPSYQSNNLTTANEMKKTGKTSSTPPPPPPRSSSSSCSSRGSSLCTAKYNPTTSSASDIASLVAEETHQHRYQPLTMRELCLKRLLELPFGDDILQELAETSKSMESYTDFLSSKYFSKCASNEIEMVDDVSSGISVGKSSKDMTSEKTIPISKEWIESPADRVRRFGRSLDSFAGLTKPSKEWMKSLTEIDILREKVDLEKSKDIHLERNIPISKDWQDTAINRSDLDCKTNTPVFRDLLQGMKKTEVLKEMNGEVVTDTSIPISTDSLSRSNGKPESTEYSIPITKAWEDTRSSVKETITSADECFVRKEEIKRGKESYKHKEEVQATKQQNSSSTKEFTVPIRKDWIDSKNPVEHHGKKEVVIPITKDWQNNQPSKVNEFVKPVHQDNLQKTISDTIEKTRIIEHSVSNIEDISTLKTHQTTTKEQEYKNQKEFIVPIIKETGNITGGAKSKEVIVPIIQETKKQEQHKVYGEVVGDSKDANTKPKEIIIPVIQESYKQNGKSYDTTKQDYVATKVKYEDIKNFESLNSKEVLIPIVRESKNQHQQTVCSKNVNFVTGDQNAIQSPNKTAGAKEFFIPIVQDSEKKHKNTTGTKHVNFAPMAEDQNATLRQNSTAVLKEVIIPIMQENHPATKTHKELNMPTSKDWVGLPSDKDPKHLLCLSPKQKEELEKSKKVPQEADKLMDLHEKYYQRTTSEELKKTPSHENVTITSIQPIPSTNRLLTIIREEPSTNTEDPDFLYFLEKDPKPPNALHRSLEILNTEASRPHNTLPRMSNAETARLRARNLNEWLNLARNKSMSESNLSTAPDVPENNLRNMCNPPEAPRRRTSLPNERLERQMIHLQEKEREIQRQLEQLEDERRRLNAEMAPSKEFHPEDYRYSRKGDFAETKPRPTSAPAMPTEFFRQQMYEEFLDKFAEREERKHQKVIKVSSAKDEPKEKPANEIIHPVQIEDEFMEKVHQKQQQGKLEKVKTLDKESSAEKEKDEEEPTLIMDGREVKRKKKLPKHLQEFMDITKQGTATGDGVWSPGQHQEYIDSPKEFQSSPRHHQDDGSGIPPVWTPKSANSSPVVERKEFKPVSFQSPVLGRKNRTKSESLGSESPSSELPRKVPDYSSDSGFLPSRFEKRLPTSHSSPASGFNELSTPTPRLPKAQNPTITLLQKAREGHLPRGPNYIEVESKPFRPRNDRPPIASPGEVLYQIKHEYTSDSETDRPRKMADLGPRKFEGVGPVTKEGMPLILRSEVKDQNQSKWYKKMYDTIHKQRPRNDEYVTVRYKQRRAQYPYSSGYLSEPEPGAYDSDFTDYKYQTLDRRKPMTERIDYSTSTMPRSMANRSSSSDILRNTHEQYKNQPGRIENYTPGHSSISEKEAKEHLEQQKRVPTHHQQQQGFMSQAFKESGYESDSTLVFRRREEAQQQLNPKEQREAYKTIQKGGDVPLYGLRKPAPERPKESELLEYIPISPTLTRIRIHKNITPQKEVICYPVTVHHQPPNTFSTYKRTAPSTVTYSNIPTPPPIPPPSPPRRRSSRNNATLRLVSTMKVKAEKSPLCKRHETCFTTTSNIDKSKVNYLKDKITCKLSPTLGKRSASPKLKVVKKVTTSPDLKNRITSTLTATKDPKTSLRKIQSKTNIHSNVCRSKSCDTVRSPARPPSSRRSPSEESLATSRSLTRTFGTEKKRFDLRIQTPRIAKSPDLLSPTEVKKAVQTQTKSFNTTYKKSNAVLASTKSSKDKEFIPIKVGIADKAKNVLRSSLPSSPKFMRASPCPSISSDKSKLDTFSPKQPRKLPVKLKTRLKDDKRTLKSRKEQINDDIMKKDRDKVKSKRDKAIDKTRKCVGKAEGSEIVKHLNVLKEKEQSTPTLKEIRKQKEAIETNHFFQHLFLRNISPTPSAVSKGSWIIEKTNQLQRRRSSLSEPSIGAMKIYLKHTKPVSDSRFVSLDAHFRSRSASPKSVTFDNSSKLKDISKRSSSLPPKLIFSQTSRPVSPVVQHKKSVSPPPSPKLSRSPSSRKIMQIKADKRSQDYNLYMCPSLNQSTTSLDSLKSEDYQRFFNEFMSVSKRSDKFKDLNQFYSEIEKVGRLEKAFYVKPRKKSEYEIIDFDRWVEVRTREKAEQELDVLYNRIREEEKEKGFLYLPKDVNKFRWRRECDRGLRIKEKSVEDIREEFERIKQEEAEKENARRRELAYPKDTYKTLWRGSSVTNMAHTMIERRSQSEGRIRSARQRLLDEERLLDHGIGSRIWSSLSMEQVNILKAQLADIFNGHIPPKPRQDYSVQVPDNSKRIHVPALTVRRNSDSSEQIYKRNMPSMSEDDKKKISQTLSRELLDKMAQKRKADKKALPLVAPKETLGAVAAADANIKRISKKEEPPKALVKTNALTNGKISSETESGSTDESTRTVICVEKTDDIKKKVEYFEKVKDLEPYTPTIYTAGDEEIDEIEDDKPKVEQKKDESKIFQSKSCQSMKEYFGESELMKYATVPSVRKHKAPPKSLEVRSTEISPMRSEESMASAISNDSLYRSESPYEAERQTLSKTGEVNRLKKKFEYWEDMYGNITLKRSRSESDINKFFPIPNFGYVDSLRRKYEYPAYSGRGRSRTRRGGVVSPIFLKAEDRFMPHINIISKIASLYAKQNSKSEKERQRSMAELSEILGCPIGEVEKLRDKFDSMEDISLVGHMYTSSPSIRELKDIAPYLAADWASHRYPRFEDNTRSLSSPETSIASRDTSLVRKDRTRPKSTSPAPKPKKPPSPILKQPQKKSRSTDFRQNQKYDPRMHEPVARYQPTDVARYRNGWSGVAKPTVSFKEPEPPLPPPKGLRTDNVEAESPRKYVENEVTIHYRTPVRQEVKGYLSEDELAQRHAFTARRVYDEERRKKYLQVSKSLQELQDMNSRRHTDNFTPSQKSPISLNRYDDFDDLAVPAKPRPRSPEPRLVARALYNFVGQTARELTFRKGDLIYVRRQVDKNWYEGELNAMVGLFPVNYVEIVPYDGAKTTPRKPHEGQARAKFNFLAQTHLELSLAKGELVVITRKVDENWFEGKIGGRKGIFPASYVEVLIDPQTGLAAPSKPVASPAAHSLLLNGSAGGKESMGAHQYAPTLAPGYPRQETRRPPVEQELHVDTQGEPVPYRALYKYTPQNDDELELCEGDTVYVLEKCDDGWYVGSSERTGAFGTFPGNYVEKI